MLGLLWGLWKELWTLWKELWALWEQLLRLLLLLLDDAAWALNGLAGCALGGRGATLVGDWLHLQWGLWLWCRLLYGDKLWLWLSLWGLRLLLVNELKLLLWRLLLKLWRLLKLWWLLELWWLLLFNHLDELLGLLGCLGLELGLRQLNKLRLLLLNWHLSLWAGWLQRLLLLLLLLYKLNQLRLQLQLLLLFGDLDLLRLLLLLLLLSNLHQLWLLRLLLLNQLNQLWLLWLLLNDLLNRWTRSELGLA